MDVSFVRVATDSDELVDGAGKWERIHFRTAQPNIKQWIHSCSLRPKSFPSLMYSLWIKATSTQWTLGGESYASGHKEKKSMRKLCRSYWHCWSSFVPLEFSWMACVLLKNLTAYCPLLPRTDEGGRGGWGQKSSSPSLPVFELPLLQQVRIVILSGICVIAKKILRSYLFTSLTDIFWWKYVLYIGWKVLCKTRCAFKQQ